MEEIVEICDALEESLEEFKVVRSKRVPASTRIKRKRYYRKRKSAIKRKAKIRRRKPTSKRLAKRRSKIRKRLKIKPGSRRRLQIAWSDRVFNLLEGKQMSLRTQLIKGFKLAKEMALEIHEAKLPKEQMVFGMMLPRLNPSEELCEDLAEALGVKSKKTPAQIIAEQADLMCHQLETEQIDESDASGFLMKLTKALDEEVGDEPVEEPEEKKSEGYCVSEMIESLTESSDAETITKHIQNLGLDKKTHLDVEDMKKVMKSLKDAGKKELSSFVGSLLKDEEPMLEWAYKFKNKQDQQEQVRTFVGDMMMSRIENDANDPDFDPSFVGSEVEDHIGGLWGHVNGKKTSDVWKELVKGLDQDDIDEATQDIEGLDRVTLDGWAYYTKEDYVEAVNKILGESKIVEEVKTDIDYEIGHAALASAVADYVENNMDSEDEDEEKDELTQEIEDSIIKPGQDIVAELEHLMKINGLDLKKFIPEKFVKYIKDAVNKQWGKDKFKEFQDKFPTRLYALGLQALGHGVSPDDDKDVSDWMKENDLEHLDLGYDELWDEAYKVVKALKNKMKNESLEEKIHPWVDGKIHFYDPNSHEGLIKVNGENIYINTEQMNIAGVDMTDGNKVKVQIVSDSTFKQISGIKNAEEQLVKEDVQKYALKNIESGEIVKWTIDEILKEINSDRSEQWTPFNENDWEEGLTATAWELIGKSESIEESKSNKEIFKEVYAEKLKEAHKKHPDLYAWPLSEFDAVLDRIYAAIDKMSFNKDSHAFKETCKELKIPHTYKAIKQFIDGGKNMQEVTAKEYHEAVKNPELVSDKELADKLFSAIEKANTDFHRDTAHRKLSKDEIRSRLWALKHDGTDVLWNLSHKDPAYEYLAKLVDEKKITQDEADARWVEIYNIVDQKLLNIVAKEIENFSDLLVAEGKCEGKESDELVDKEIDKFIRSVMNLPDSVLTQITGLNDGVTLGYLKNSLEDWLADNAIELMDGPEEYAVVAFLEAHGIPVKNGKAQKEDTLKLFNENKVISINPLKNELELQDKEGRISYLKLPLDKKASEYKVGDMVNEDKNIEDKIIKSIDDMAINQRSMTLGGEGGPKDQDLDLEYWLEESHEKELNDTDFSAGLVLLALAKKSDDFKKWINDPKNAKLSYGESTGMMPYSHANYPKDALVYKIWGYDSEEEVQIDELDYILKGKSKQVKEALLKDPSNYGIYISSEELEEKINNDEHFFIVWPVQVVVAQYFKLEDALKQIKKDPKIKDEKSLIAQLKDHAGTHDQYSIEESVKTYWTAIVEGVKLPLTFEKPVTEKFAQKFLTENYGEEAKLEDKHDDEANKLLKLFLSKKSTDDVAAEVDGELPDLSIGDVTFMWGNRELIAYTDDKTYIWDLNNLGSGDKFVLFSIEDKDGKQIEEVIASKLEVDQLVDAIGKELVKKGFDYSHNHGDTEFSILRGKKEGFLEVYLADPIEEDGTIYSVIMWQDNAGSHDVEVDYSIHDGVVHGVDKLVKELNKSVFPKKKLKEDNDELRVGMSIIIPDEELIKQNAKELGLEIDWEVLNKDIQKLEKNAAKVMKDKYGISFNDEGHGSDGVLIGTAFVPNDMKSLALDHRLGNDPLWQNNGAPVEVFDGLSEIGKQVLDVSIDFFGDELDSLEESVYYVKLDGQDLEWPSSLEKAKKTAEEILQKNKDAKIEIEAYSGNKRGEGGSLLYKLVGHEGKLKRVDA